MDAADKADRFHAGAGWLQRVLKRLGSNHTLTTMRGEAGEVDEEYERRLGEMANLTTSSSTIAKDQKRLEDYFP